MNRLLDISSDIAPSPLDPATVVDGDPGVWSQALAAVAGVEVEVWEMTPGTATDVEFDEVFIVIFRLGDDDVRVRAGHNTIWTLPQTLCKI